MRPAASTDLGWSLIRQRSTPGLRYGSPMAIERFDDGGVSRVLCVVAHPDDLEYGASAAVHHWTTSGVEVAYLLLTSGEAGMQAPPEEVGPLRAAEQREACAAVGVQRLTILDHPDGVLQPSLDLRRDIAREIRAFRPDVVLTMTWEVVAPWGLNQADHRVAGLAAADAARDAGNAWIFGELITEDGLDPWGPKRLVVAGGAPATHGIVLSDADVAASVASLAAHRAYLADLPDHPAPADFLPPMLAGQGAELGVDAALLVRCFDL